MAHHEDKKNARIDVEVILVSQNPEYIQVKADEDAKPVSLYRKGVSFTPDEKLWKTHSIGHLSITERRAIEVGLA